MSNARNWVGLFLLGAINNLPYVIINSASKTIAQSFGVQNFVGLVFGANVSLAAFVRVLNAFVLLKTPYWTRIFANGVLMLLGLFGVAYAFNFPFALACIVVAGSSAAFGENVTLGYLSLFPSKLVNGWSSGTGMAGLLGAGIYIIFGCSVGTGGGKAEQLKYLNKMAFLLTTPVVLIYWFSYAKIIQRPRQVREPAETMPAEDAEERKALLDNSINTGQEIVGETFMARLWRCLKLVLWLAVNLGLVYLFEYVARACAAKVRPKDEYNIGCPELYSALQFCYQAGVFASRSSLQIVQIRRVEILTLLQGINMVVWVLDVHYKFLPVWILPAYMIFVGLMGGASYVNIFYLLLKDSQFPDEDRELCINITALFSTIGIATGCGVETALFTTVLSKD
ncbi:battenin-like [Branchiostoma floridae]|uniref:Battenin n=1 Tax=Branchiostoma floridae TaxID=7739 RepID=A0A9J7HL10_BRAFL|nr:battenin-like [Branchiostoma floridae]XP_035661510.1 battenin-like [Branchiostoma floridae]XP_035661518.1 battenin-like [Branchiostoma floridae]XP_035661525.1 battenin-like [Branchiostoma floridae]XP_035661534.1 battenin-like [Branchiostoma floridae]XP_035661543.1 battenin-like [Branchiostoma floridae]